MSILTGLSLFGGFTRLAGVCLLSLLAGLALTLLVRLCLFAGLSLLTILSLLSRLAVLCVRIGQLFEFATERAGLGERALDIIIVRKVIAHRVGLGLAQAFADLV